MIANCDNVHDCDNGSVDIGDIEAVVKNINGDGDVNVDEHDITVDVTANERVVNISSNNGQYSVIGRYCGYVTCTYVLHFTSFVRLHYLLPS